MAFDKWDIILLTLIVVSGVMVIMSYARTGELSLLLRNIFEYIFIGLLVGYAVGHIMRKAREK